MPYEGSIQAIRSVLERMGVDPHERIHEYDQDRGAGQILPRRGAARSNLGTWNPAARAIR